MRPGTRFALDLGEARIGVAKSDASGILASPFGVYKTADDWLAPLAKALTEWEAIELLIGLPTDLAGKNGIAAQNILKRVSEIQAAISDIPIRLVDERFTTVSARRNLQAAGYNSRSDKSLIDAAAATVLLQAALDAERATGEPGGEMF
jgi:putative Holliday junction resolvase